VGGARRPLCRIRLKQLAAEAQAEVGVCVIEKGSEIGAHILSGAVMDPRALTEAPARLEGARAPLKTPVSRTTFSSRRGGSFEVPNGLPARMLPQSRQLRGVSLGNVCRWLAQQAERWGWKIYPGFAAAECALRRQGRRARRRHR